MSIEKSLYQAPAGLDALDQEPDIEIEVEDPEALSVSVDGEEILDVEKGEVEEDFDENLAEVLSSSDLQLLASDLAEDIDGDIDSIFLHQKGILRNRVDYLHFIIPPV